jgi:hypothetical protein
MVKPGNLTDEMIRIARTAFRSEIEELIGLVHDCNDQLAYGTRLDAVRMSNDLAPNRLQRIADAINARNGGAR